MFIPTNTLIKMADIRPLIYKWLLNIATGNIPRWFQASLKTFSTRKIRVLYCLTTLLPLSMTKDNQIEISQQQVNDICGSSRPIVNKVLKTLEQQDILQISYKK